MGLRLDPAAAGIAIGAALLAFASGASAQSPQPDLVAVAGEGGAVFVYVTADLPASARVNLVRVTDSGEDLLTSPPLAATQNPGRFVAQLGERYERLAGDLGTSNATETLLRLTGDRTLGVITSLADSTVGRLLGRLFVDWTPVPGTSSYRAVVLDWNGREVGRSFEAAVVEPDPIPPGNVVASATGNRVTVDWTYDATTQLDDFVTHFRVETDNGSGTDFIAASEEGTLRLSSHDTYRFATDVPFVGRTYRFAVTAVTAGWTFVRSEVVEVFVRDNVPPDRVTSIVARAEADSAIVLSWQPPASDPTAPQYIIRRATKLAGPFEEIARRAGSGEGAFVDRDVRARTTYHYSIAAVDSVGNEGLPGDVANAYVPDLTSPPGPSNLTANPTGGGVALTWQGGVAADLNTYVVLRRRVDDRGPVEPHAQANASAVRTPSFFDEGPAGGFVDGAFYEFTVAAADSAANYSDSTSVVIQIPDVSPPRPVSSVRVEEQDRYATLTWAASTSRDVVEYGVFRVTGATEELVGTTTATRRGLRDGPLPLDVDVLYRVEARDSSGNAASAHSDRLVVRDRGAPAPPRNLQAARVGTTTELRWTASPVDGVTVYEVERATSAGAPFAGIGTTEATTWSDPGGRPGYVYRIVARDAAGNRSPPSVRAILR